VPAAQPRAAGEVRAGNEVVMGRGRGTGACRQQTAPLAAHGQQHLPEVVPWLQPPLIMHSGQLGMKSHVTS